MNLILENDLIPKLATGQVKGFEIPISIRAFVYQGFRFPPLKQLGNTYYDYAAKQSAKLLQQCVPGAKVILFGGSVDRCVPGISDLDFLVIKRDEYSKTEIGDLRSAYFELKRKFPVLGEVHASRKNAWEQFEQSTSAARLWFADRKRYDSGVWKRTRSKSRVPISKYSRFALCLHHFERAQRHLIRALGSQSAFHRANFVREISKVICWAETNAITLQTSFNPAAQMGLAFYQLQLLAKKAIREELPQIEDLELDIPKAKGIRFVTEMLNRRWQERLIHFGGSLAKIRVSNAPSIFLSNQPMSLGASLGLYQSFTDFLKSEAEIEKLPFLLTEEIHECASLGWVWGRGYPHLEWFSTKATADQEWIKKCARHTFERLREQVSLELNLITGKFICQSPEVVQKEIFQLAQGVLSLNLQYLTTNSERLLARASSEFPLTVKALTETADQNKLLGLDRLLTHCRAILDEVGTEQGGLR